MIRKTADYGARIEGIRHFSPRASRAASQQVSFRHRLVLATCKKRSRLPENPPQPGSRWNGYGGQRPSLPYGPILPFSHRGGERAGHWLRDRDSIEIWTGSRRRFSPLSLSRSIRPRPWDPVTCRRLHLFPLRQTAPLNRGSWRGFGQIVPIFSPRVGVFRIYYVAGLCMPSERRFAYLSNLFVRKGGG